MTLRKRLYLDKDRAKIAGVCAGIADYFDWDVNLVRLGWIIATMFGVPFMIIAYVLCAWLLEPKPGSSFTRSRLREEVYGTSEPVKPGYRLADAKARFEYLERRLRSLEGVVTSREFQMDRELRGSGRP